MVPVTWWWDRIVRNRPGRPRAVGQRALADVGQFTQVAAGPTVPLLAALPSASCAPCP